jgi:hypothetical protein
LGVFGEHIKAVKGMDKSIYKGKNKNIYSIKYKKKYIII